ncbi:MAG: formate dehydrogenase accessory sulfurtransferase FdhD [Verrucomicrobiota bacterium]|nr:formate dehydrogenase accessory sulfurtransferase FdhD [Verrucomicrobiota bacterium]
MKADVASGTVVRRNADGSCACIIDEVTVEEPLELRIGRAALAVTMRTPGHDEELAAGFLLAEAIVRTRRDLRELAHCVLPNSLGNVFNITLSETATYRPDAAHRFGSISTSCGLCGKTSIDFIRQQFPAIEKRNERSIATSVLLQLPDQLRGAQTNFARTGGIHAAGIFETSGRLLFVREDIGRHNAVDKVIGRALLDDLLPLQRHILVVSGRTSLEIVQKALAAGIPIVASVSAPSTLAVNFAREVGQTLIGFLRPPTLNVYSHVERVAFDEPKR